MGWGLEEQTEMVERGFQYTTKDGLAIFSYNLANNTV